MWYEIFESVGSYENFVIHLVFFINIFFYTVAAGDCSIFQLCSVKVDSESERETVNAKIIYFQLFMNGFCVTCTFYTILCLWK